MPKGLDIAVCGAGPAGLASALYLQRLGHRPIIVERFETAKPLGSGLILQPTGQAVLHDLGLFSAIRALGSPIDRLRGTDARTGRVVLDVGYDALPNAGRGLAVHRAALFGVLHEAVEAAGIPIHTNSEVLTVRDLPERKRALVFAGDRQSDGFDLVVDALGSASPLKAHSRSPGKSRPLSFGAIWATLPWHGEGFDGAALLQRYKAASVMVGVLPIGRAEAEGLALAALFWSLKVADYEALKRDGVEAWKQEVLTHWPEAAAYLDRIGGFETMTLARYAHHTMTDPTGDGLVFIGDSAHSTSPQLGQGANMALLDARALYIGLRDKGDDREAALAHYAALRRNHVRLYQALSAMFTPFYQSDSVVLPVLRDLFVAHLARIPPAPRFLAALVSGSLLSPLKKLGLERPPEY